MKPAPSLSSFLRAVFPERGEDFLRLCETAAENSNLLRVDFYTIRDLVELSGYTNQEALHVLLLLMLLALDEGSLCIDASKTGLARRLADLAGTAEAQAWAGCIATHLDAGNYSLLIGERVDEGKPVVLRKSGMRTYLYFQKYLKHELALQAELRRRLGMDPSTARLPFPKRQRGENTAPPLPHIIREVLGEQPLIVGGRPIKLNRDQQLAIGLALLRDFVIVSGGPGTGKTSIVFTLLRCLVRAGIVAERIALAAPTGRAAQRLTDAVRTGLTNVAVPGEPDHSLKTLTATTLHQLLGYNPARDTYRHHAENPLPYDVVIVDEVSMVGLVLMARLFQALAPAAKLILLGDKDQLPSVDAGAVLANLAPAGRTPSYSRGVCAQLDRLFEGLRLKATAVTDPLRDVLVVLEENYRSQRSIHDFARALNVQQTEIIDSLPQVAPGHRENSFSLPFADLEKEGGCWLIEYGQGDAARWRQVLEQWAAHHYLSPRPGGDVYCDLVARCDDMEPNEPAPEQRSALERLFALLAGSRILTLLREGTWGCSGINAYLEQVLRPRLDRPARGKWFAGMPVLVTRNDHNRLLFNGDVGLALRGRNGYRVFFQRAGAYVGFAAETLPAHEPAFAITVHKAQGSEYDQVLLVMPPEGGRRLLTKEMVYTGVTRAKHLAVICSKKEVLSCALGRRIERASGLMDFDAQQTLFD
ncbi:MAG TPA: exodeoxyribonuclease V subunit alpha [Gemmataceae bacterium]|nr:exodeoxyribonuclease V subunit alpha [Gemmataceae bacterium]